eukprot:UC4_evm3s1406
MPAYPVDKDDPYLLHWVRDDKNGPARFTDQPCSFPGKIWRSNEGGYNMLCAYKGARPWVRFHANDSDLMLWTEASPRDPTSNIPSFMWWSNGTAFRGQSAAGPLFNKVPGKSEKYIINGNTGTGFYIGEYDKDREIFIIDSSELQYISIDGGGGPFTAGSAHWAAVSNQFDEGEERLLWVSWLSHAPNTLTLVRSIEYDERVQHIVSNPVQEYSLLRNESLVDNEIFLIGPSKFVTIPNIPGSDASVTMSFDITITFAPTRKGKSTFGLAVRAPQGSREDAGLQIEINVGPILDDGSRYVEIGGANTWQPRSNDSSHLFPVEGTNKTRLFEDEVIDVRVLVDRSIFEIFVMKGRIAWVRGVQLCLPNEESDYCIPMNNNFVHIFNEGEEILHTNVSAWTMGCGWANTLPLPRESAAETSNKNVHSSKKTDSYIIGPSFEADPVYDGWFPNASRQPKGHSYSFNLLLAQSKFYDCTDKTNSKPYSSKPCNVNRSVTVYIPSQYNDGDETKILVAQDGPFFDKLLIPIMDSLIGQDLPVFILVSISTGTNFDGEGTLRDIQYDTVSGKYARFVNEEVFPAVKQHVSLDFPNLKITPNSDGRMTLGCSSGGAAAFSMAWFEPELFRRVVAYSPTLVHKDSKLPSAKTFPLGAWEYHSPPASLISNSPKKSLKIFHSVNERDLGTTGNEPYDACVIDPYPNGNQSIIENFTEGCFSFPNICVDTRAQGRLAYHNTMDVQHSNWKTAAYRTSKVLSEKNYNETRFLYALGACHCELDKKGFTGLYYGLRYSTSAPLVGQKNDRKFKNYKMII